MNTDYYFPTPIWWQDTPINLDPLRALCSKIKETDKGRQMSNFGGWQSNDILVGDHTATDEFCKFVEAQSIKCIQDFGYAPSTQLKVSNLWFSSNNDNAFNQVHNHAGAFISGTFYIDVPQSSGEIVFYRNSHEEYIISGAAPIVQHTAISGATCRYEPREARLVMFPGFLQHAVMPTPSKEDRVSMSFNMRIVNV